MVELRRYQEEGVAKIQQQMAANNRRVLYVLPTGGGKTVIFTELTRRTVAAGGRVLILQHRKRLIRQCKNGIGMEYGVIQARQPSNRHAPVQIASVNTLSRRLDQYQPDEFDLLVVDEGHHAPAGEWARVLQHFDRSNHLLVTATPCRKDGRGLRDFADVMVLGPSPNWLTDNGYLARMRVLRRPMTGIDEFKYKGHDFDQQQASNVMSDRQIVGNVVDHYLDHVRPSGKLLGFCCSVAHAQIMAAEYNKRGIPAASIDGAMNDLQQSEIFDRLEHGDLLVLMSCQLVDEGVNVPNLDAIQLLAPTHSLRVHLQRVGRGLRTYQGRRKVLLDHVGDCSRHGHYLDDRQWSLDAPKRKSRGVTGPSVSECIECYSAIPSGSLVCPYCDAEQPKPKPKDMRIVDGQLVEWTAEMAAQEAKLKANREVAMARTLEQLQAIAKERGYQPGWAYHKYRARHRS